MCLQLAKTVGTKAVSIVLAQIGPRGRAKRNAGTLTDSGRVMHAEERTSAAGTLFRYAGRRGHLYRKRLMDFFGVFSNGSSLISIWLTCE